MSRSLESIENLILALCKCQKWKEQIKVSIFRKVGGLILKTVTVVRFLKTKNTPKFLKGMYEHLHGIEAGRASMPVQRKTPVYSLLNFLFLKPLQMPYFFPFLVLTEC